jgi:hypothetical protein
MTFLYTHARKYFIVIILIGWLITYTNCIKAFYFRKRISLDLKIIFFFLKLYHLILWLWIRAFFLILWCEKLFSFSLSFQVRPHFFYRWCVSECFWIFFSVWYFWNTQGIISYLWLPDHEYSFLSSIFWERQNYFVMKTLQR